MPGERLISPCPFDCGCENISLTAPSRAVRAPSVVRFYALYTCSSRINSFVHGCSLTMDSIPSNSLFENNSSFSCKRGIPFKAKSSFFKAGALKQRQSRKVRNRSPSLRSVPSTYLLPSRRKVRECVGIESSSNPSR